MQFNGSMTVIYVVLIAVVSMAYGKSSTKMVFAGMVGIIDPPREGVREAIETLSATGVSIKMVTGDAGETAIAIGESEIEETPWLWVVVCNI